MGKLNLSHAFDLFKLQEYLLNARPCIMGNAFRDAVRQHKTMEAIKMINDQLANGCQQDLEFIISAPALELIKRFS